MYVDAVATLPPVGISMLSVQIIPPSFGIAHLSFGLSARSWTHVARPGDATRRVALRQRRDVVVARELPIWPESTASWTRSIAPVNVVVRDLRRVVAVRQHDEPDRVRHLAQHRHLALQLRVLEQLRRSTRDGAGQRPRSRRSRSCPTATAASTRGPGRRAGSPARRSGCRSSGSASLSSFCTQPLSTSSPGKRELSVEDDDVAVDPAPLRERALDLREVLGVVVDVLEVVDRDRRSSP